MKLLHVTATHLNFAGGIPAVLKDLVQAQNQIEEFEARVLSIKADAAAMNSDYFDTLENSPFVIYIDQYNPDIVIFHSHYYFEYNRCFRYLIKKKIPYFIEPHGSFGKAALEKSKIKKWIANRIIFNAYLKNAKGFIFLNESELEDSKFKTSYDLIIPNGISNIEIDYPLNANRPWFFYYIGRFDVHHKGLDYLFDALEIIDKIGKNFNVNIYGTGSNKEISYINKRIRALKNIAIQNCGPLYGERQRVILEQCGIMLLTSRYEGFPMTVLEAWKYGNPCIVTSGTNVSDETIINNVGWKCELNADAIAKCIIESAEEYSLKRERYVIQCKKYVAKEYSWNGVAKRSHEQLSTIISK